MFNNVTMMGRIVNDLELKVTPNGTSVCTFRIAVERRYQTKGEDLFGNGLTKLTKAYIIFIRRTNRIVYKEAFIWQHRMR